MRQQRTPSRIFSRHALIACGIAILFVLQALLSPLVATAAAARQGGESPSVSMTVFGEICHTDSGDPDGKGHHAHRDCCILCESNLLRDATLVFAVAWLATALPSLREDHRPVSYLVPDDARPRAIGWASSWSSRAPPSFS